MSSKLISYAMDFASFLMQKISDKNTVKNIILFGSVAREESGKESDIDIFIDLAKNNEKIEKEILRHLEGFIESVKCKTYWRMFGIENEIKLTIGVLNEWNDLKPSILSNGMTLYGKFKLDIKGNHETFFIWENIKPNSERVLFNKQLLGYKQNNRFYDGLTQ